MEIVGEHTTADVKTEEADEATVEQIQEMVNHEAFRNDVVIQADTHYGAGAVIGFTMPLGQRVCPNTVGMDIGCGMTAVQLPGEIDLDDWSLRADLDDEVRERVPTGFDTHSGHDFHMYEDFPWDRCQEKLEAFNENSDFEDIEADYGPEYFDDLMSRIEYDTMRAINSIGTLGGGNHFIEIGESEEIDDRPYWAIIHSGSRGPGGNIARYWQQRATKLRSISSVRSYLNTLPDEYFHYTKFTYPKVNDEDLLDWLKGGMGEDFVAYDRLKLEYADSDPEKIGEISDKLKDALDHARADDRNTDLDYLEGSEIHGYVVDMIFAQTYASVSRSLMANKVLDSWNAMRGGGREGFVRTIESIHNYIDFEDQVVRKGACRAEDGERLVIPFNMSEGTLICEGKGKDEWNNSAPHGAGRAMSRTRAKNEHNEGDFDEQTRSVYMSEEPLDEIPTAYKDPEVIEEALGDTATILDRVKPLISIKAE